MEKVAQKGVGRGGKMTDSTQGSNNVNVNLSFNLIREFLKAIPFDELPSAVKTGDLAKKKEMAEKALEHLESFFNSKIGDMTTSTICGPKPTIPVSA